MAKQQNPQLSAEQKRVLFEAGTEAPGSGALLHETADGTYRCVNCGAELFKSTAKYESTTPGLIGWPSFGEAAANDALVLTPDTSLGTVRTAVSCAQCGVHLGHLFVGVDDTPSGKHYCINSCALRFDKNQA